jgi:hypothetical protein
MYLFAILMSRKHCYDQSGSRFSAGVGEIGLAEPSGDGSPGESLIADCYLHLLAYVVRQLLYLFRLAHLIDQRRLFAALL